MTMMIELKERMKAVYAKAGFVLLPFIRFLLAFAVFSFLNQKLGYMELLNSSYVTVVLALICAILPSQAITVFGMMIMIGHCFALHIVIAGCVAILLFFILLIGLHFSSKEAVVLFLTPIAYAMNVPALVPICLGLVGDMFSAFVSAGGVILWYLLNLISGHVAELAGGDKVEILTLVQSVFQGIGQNEGMIIAIIACMATVFMIAFVRRLHLDYAWQLSVAFGGICYAFVMLAGSLLLDMDSNIVMVLVGTAVSMLIGFALQFFLFGADYSAAEYLEYEDDDYVYFVKAVPKYKISKRPRSSRVSSEPEEAEESAVSSALSQQEPEQPPVVERTDEANIDFENRLEESLKEL